MFTTKKITRLGSLLLFGVLLLNACITIGPQPLSYRLATDLEIPSPAIPSNTVFVIIHCNNVVGILKDNIELAENALERDLTNLNFSEVNCYRMSRSEMNQFYDDMTGVIEIADYDLSEETFIDTETTKITIELWETREKTKILVYLDVGNFVVATLTE